MGRDRYLEEIPPPPKKLYKIDAKVIMTGELSKNI
jgi:hypothetical protein